MSMVRLNRPKYGVGQVLDLSRTRGKNKGMKLPNRVLVDTVIQNSEQSMEWHYHVIYESNGVKVCISESVLFSIVNSKSAGVYKLPEIRERMLDGWRFVGNYVKSDELSHLLKTLCNNNEIANVRIYNALDERGNAISNETFGVWIRYNNRIENGVFADHVVHAVNYISKFNLPHDIK